MSKSSVAIVTPLYRFSLTPDEEMSIRHLREYLGEYDRFIIGPRKPPSGFGDFGALVFPADYFADTRSYSHLMVSREFYRAFRTYEYILIYQLDCLVFSRDLDAWCSRQWDYVGAPWTNGYVNEGDPGFMGVGNGGLSLRHVENALRVLNSRRLWADPAELGARTRFASAPAPLRKTIQLFKTGLHALGYKNRVQQQIEKMAGDAAFQEDLFWSLYAKDYLPSFSIPPPEEAVRFSFEIAPRYCFKVTGGQLPFGCHAWAKYDRKFWEPYLLKD